jgi:asparagine synthase (glutamine-hydrolysing)
MCGILGLFHPAGADQATLNLGPALDLLFARGPDASGTWSDAQLVLGHRRLAVIDLSAEANQPMVSHDGRLVIVFNGEIYNFSEVREVIGSYPYRTQSDTETILAAYERWGTDCLARFHGMFAFALWDRDRQELFVARDRLGVKPLFFAADGTRFAFASRPKALLALLSDLVREIDRQALRLYLECGYVPAPWSIVKGIRKLEPGHFLVVRAGAVSKHRYWSTAGIGIDSDLSDRRTEGELLDELDELVQRSVRWRMVSSVPVGAFLSGGIDSSLVVACMRKNAASRVRTYTIGFEDPSFDESSAAAEVAAFIGAEHTAQRLTPDDLLALVPRFLQEFDEPFFDYSAFPTMAVSQLARRDVKVALSGDGGDEAFGGYHYYRIAEQTAAAYKFPAGWRRAASVAVRPMGRKGRLLSRALRENSVVRAYAFSRSVIKDHVEILSPGLLEGTRSMADLFAAEDARLPATLSPAERAMRIDLAYTLPDDYLQKVDLSSMAYSLEVREPMLDHSIFEWSARLPLKYKVRGRVNKYLLRKLAFRHVPREIIDRPKRGFGVPMAAWLRGPLKQWADELLADASLVESLGLNHDRLRSLWRRHQEHRDEAHTALWTVMVLLQFARTSGAKATI